MQFHRAHSEPILDIICMGMAVFIKNNSFFKVFKRPIILSYHVSTPFFDKMRNLMKERRLCSLKYLLDILN